jgi:predicted  nucleic acid-binding Zn-ribbon protein
MDQPTEDAAAQLKREHEAAKQRLESLREEARKLGREFEEKLKPEILEAEVELTRLSGMLGQIGL